MTKARQKKSSVEPMTMTQFRAWLQGITDMQPANWHPNLEQWNTIKQRLDSVIDAPVASVHDVTYAPTSTNFPVNSAPHELSSLYPGHQPSPHQLSAARPEDILAANSLVSPTVPGQSAFA